MGNQLLTDLLILEADCSLACHTGRQVIPCKGHCKHTLLLLLLLSPQLTLLTLRKS